MVDAPEEVWIDTPLRMGGITVVGTEIPVSAVGNGNSLGTTGGSVGEITGTLGEEAEGLINEVSDAGSIERVCSCPLARLEVAPVNIEGLAADRSDREGLTVGVGCSLG